MIPFEINELNSKYDVFISFRGGDVRETFLSVLYFHLNDYRKMRVYKDDVDLERGRQISPSILEAVERSESYIVIFSPNFASSEWCLDELVKILECGERYGRKVIPVFYGGVDPSHVENLTGSYRKVPSETIGKVRSWRAALTTAASFSGFDSRVIRGLIARGSAVG
ncbi:TMV resistance protein N [Linum perenne]